MNNGKERNEMKKILIAFILSLLFLSGCVTESTHSSFGVEPRNDDILVEAENAEEGMSGSASPLIVEEGQIVVIDAADLDGMIKVSLVDGPEVTVSGKDTAKFDADPGEYSVDVTVEKTANGTARIFAEGK